MAKTPYRPSAMLDPLSDLKQATTSNPEQAVETAPLPESASDASTVTAQATTAVDDIQPASRLSVAPVKPVSTALKPSRNTVYLYPEDSTKLRQLSGYASSEHGIRANDSMIVRAALSLVECDVRFMHALKDAELSDRRRTK
jgi:hypothetical protein